jgi:hypothetical protein
LIGDGNAKPRDPDFYIRIENSTGSFSGNRIRTTQPINVLVLNSEVLADDNEFTVAAPELLAALKTNPPQTQQDLAALVQEHASKGALDRALRRGLTVATIVETVSRLLFS